MGKIDWGGYEVIAREDIGEWMGKIDQGGYEVIAREDMGEWMGKIDQGDYEVIAREDMGDRCRKRKGKKRKQNIIHRGENLNRRIKQKNTKNTDE